MSDFGPLFSLPQTPSEPTPPSGPLLGHIRKRDRNANQITAMYHSDAVVPHIAKFNLPTPQLSAGQRVQLFDAWKHPDVVADVGFKFDRIHQLTGSCVWAGGTNALFTTIAMQRIAGSNPTKAFLPFTLHNYAMSRHYMGDDSQGDGSMGSTFAQSLHQDGVREWPNDGKENIPTWTDNDGVSVRSSSVEYQWSSVRNSSLQPILNEAKTHLLGSAARCTSVQDIRASILNGYGVAFACDNFIGNASIQGSGDDAAVCGYWNGSGGHQQSIHAIWENASLGTLYWAQNNWPGSTYPRDPAGGPICGCWVTEAHVSSALRNLDAEVYAYSALNWFPAQPKVVDLFAL